MIVGELGQLFEKAERVLAVDMKQKFREFHVGGAVALDFAFVGIGLNFPEQAVGQGLCEYFVGRLKYGAQGPGIVQVQAQAQVCVGVVVAEEKPAIDPRAMLKQIG